MPTADQEIQQGRRFAFGKNWSAFLRTLDEDRISIAEQSLRELLQLDSLTGKSFLDVGNGSGLFSLAARRLGARVHSFDFDPRSVACAEELRSRYFSGDELWTIEQGSALDAEYLASLGDFDVVYSWGVLHHTGEMWKALDLVATCVAADGWLVIALYNDQGIRSRLWHFVKQMYCANIAGRAAVLAICIPWFFVRTVGVSLIRRRNEFAAYRRHRGMSIVHDWLDWLGGLPFEVATVDHVVEFFFYRGFEPVSIRATRRLGNNEFVFRRATSDREA